MIPIMFGENSIQKDERKNKWENYHRFSILDKINLTIHAFLSNCIISISRMCFTLHF